MIDLIFPDGSKRQYDDGATGKDVAASIAPSLAKRAALIKLEGELYDVDRALPHGGHFEILTRDARESLETLRHDASHIMAEAVQELFPGTQVT
ncbi:MAG: TGS domain-containing protein, partial [Phenylobacterium sp.]